VPRLKNFVSSILLAFGYSINSKSKKKLLGDLIRLPEGVGLSPVEARKIYKSSKSQLGQDLLTLIASGAKKAGFFVEFGASDGVALSNSHMLEKHFGWTGVLCEPSTAWHEALKQNRGCTIDTRCVYSVSGEKLSFSENYLGELSAITAFAEPNANGVLKRTTSSYEVETVSLLDLLKSHNAPKYIEFLSIDTEGSEFEILKNFDFQSYRFGAICVEHNFAKTREKINALLLAKGYIQVDADLSDFDDWYVQDTNR
jgi:FkbM family methyltransferase